MKSLKKLHATEISWWQNNMAFFQYFWIAHKSFNIHIKFDGDAAFLLLFTSTYKSKSSLKPPNYFFFQNHSNRSIFCKYRKESITLNHVLLKGAKTSPKRLKIGILKKIFLQEVLLGFAWTWLQIPMFWITSLNPPNPQKNVSNTIWRYYQLQVRQQHSLNLSFILTKNENNIQEMKFRCLFCFKSFQSSWLLDRF